MQPSTSSHPPSNRPDATETSRRRGSNLPTTTSELAGLKIRLRKSLRQFPDFPKPGILFEDILPLFSDPTIHESLIRALELHIEDNFPTSENPDVIVGLEARGFLFGPSLALRLGAGFVPVRKPGKLPGPTETASYKKEYGEDHFQIQADAIKQGQKVLILDDIIATGTASTRISIGILTDSKLRWFCCSRRFASQETRWGAPRVHFHRRTRLPQRPRQARCSRLHPPLEPTRWWRDLNY